MPVTLSLGQLAETVGAKLQGDSHSKIKCVSSLEDAQAGSITFFYDRTYLKFLKKTKASAVILKKEFLNDCPVSALICDDPRLIYAKVTQALYNENNFEDYVSPDASLGDNVNINKPVYVGPRAVIESGVKIGSQTYIGAGSFIGKGTTIGSNTVILPNVTIYHDTVLGNHVIIHSGTVIGSDGFGYANENGEWVKIVQVGSVRIGDYVEIGANTTIDRGANKDTVISQGVKLDNGIQIAHNVSVGEHTVIAAGVGVAGSTKIGKHCMIGGMTAVQGHITIVDKVNIGALCKVTKSVTSPGTYTAGTPLELMQKSLKNAVRFTQLDEIYRRLKKLEK